MKKDRIKIIYEDKYILVVDKPTNILSVSTENEKERTMFHLVYNYIKSKNKNNKIFIVHRLDKDTSGLMIFAKSEIVKQKLQDNWDKLVERYYIAIVYGDVLEKEKTIKSYIAETKTLLSYSTTKEKGKLAITKYEKIKSNKKYTMLNINILTGRKNQIRLHMKEMGHIIVGDKKYGAKTNPINRLCLHANRLIFKHPITNKIIELSSDYPKQFEELLK